jgi:hypothetical protein
VVLEPDGGVLLSDLQGVYECAAHCPADVLRCADLYVVSFLYSVREENYRELRKPLDAAVFVDELREQTTAELTLLNDGMPKLSWLDIAERKSGAIRLTPAEALPEPRNLRRSKGEVQRRWGIVPLADILKEAVLRTGCLDAVTSVSGGGSLSAEILAERLLLVIYAYGTNTGDQGGGIRRLRSYRGRAAVRVRHPVSSLEPR